MRQVRWLAGFSLVARGPPEREERGFRSRCGRPPVPPPARLARSSQRTQRPAQPGRANKTRPFQPEVRYQQAVVHTHVRCCAKVRRGPSPQPGCPTRTVRPPSGMISPCPAASGTETGDTPTQIARVCARETARIVIVVARQEVGGQAGGGDGAEAFRQAVGSCRCRQSPGGQQPPDATMESRNVVRRSGRIKSKWRSLHQASR